MWAKLDMRILQRLALKFKGHYIVKPYWNQRLPYYLNLLPNIPPTLILSRPRRSENERKMKVKLLETNVYPRFCSDIQSRYASILSPVVAVLWWSWSNCFAGGQEMSSKSQTRRAIPRQGRDSTSRLNRAIWCLPFTQMMIFSGRGWFPSKTSRMNSRRNKRRQVSTAHCGRPVEWRAQPWSFDWKR